MNVNLREDFLTTDFTDDTEHFHPCYPCHPW